MKLVTIITILCFSVAADATLPPNLVCTTEKEIHVFHGTLFVLLITWAEVPQFGWQISS
jgi:hypothetical protein